jgi:hypothetical protein
VPLQVESGQSKCLCKARQGQCVYKTRQIKEKTFAKQRKARQVPFQGKAKQCKGKFLGKASVSGGKERHVPWQGRASATARQGSALARKFKLFKLYTLPLFELQHKINWAT